MKDFVFCYLRWKVDIRWDIFIKIRVERVRAGNPDKNLIISAMDE